MAAPRLLFLCAALCVASEVFAGRELKDVQPPVQRAGPDGCVYTVINNFVSYGLSICDEPTGCPFDRVPTAEECEFNCTQKGSACVGFHFDTNAPPGTPRCKLLSNLGTTRRGLPGNTVGIKRGSLDGSC